MNVNTQGKRHYHISHEPKAHEYLFSPSNIVVCKDGRTAERLNAKELQSFGRDLSMITPRTLKKEKRKGQYFFDLYLPTHEAITPISQLSMDDIDWMEDLYNECLEGGTPKRPVSLEANIDQDLAPVMEDIFVSTRQKSCVSPQMKRPPSIFENKNSESDQHFPSIFDSSHSLLLNYRNDFPNVSDYLESPEWKGHEKLLSEWRNFFSDKRSSSALSKGKRKILHGQLQVEFPCLELEHTSDCERRISKRKSHKGKPSTGGTLHTQGKEPRRPFQFSRKM